MKRIPGPLACRPVALLPPGFEPMLPTLVAEVPAGPGWLFELKHDGFRGLVLKAGVHVEIRSRRGTDFTALLPEIVRAVTALPVERAILDGELVGYDDNGEPVFEAIGARVFGTSPLHAERAALRTRVLFHAFDALHVDADLRARPLVERKAALAGLLARAVPLRYVEAIEGQGAEFFAAVAARGLEGIVAKRAASRYEEGRSRKWVKVWTPAGRERIMARFDLGG